MKHSLEMHKTEAGIEGVLSLWGDLTMSHVLETKKKLVEVLGQVDKLVLNLDEIDKLDVSFIQLICSAHRECVSSGKSICLQDEAGDIIREQLKSAGYCKQLGCPSVGRPTCLWQDLC